MKKSLLDTDITPPTKYTLKIVEDGCWNCDKLVKLPFVDNTIGPKHYKEELIKIANEHGATIENRFSKTRQESYNASVCPHCNQIFGEFHLSNYFYAKEVETLDVDSSLIITMDGTVGGMLEF
jgi:hypothetical protein